MKLDISIDMNEVRDVMNGWEDQVNYTVAKTINDTLTDIQTQMRAHLRDEFTVRNQSFLKGSTKITKFAKKTDLVGEFGIVNMPGRSSADILTKFEDQHSKKAEGGGMVAVPTENIRPDTNRIVPTGKRPRNLTNAVKITAHSGVEMIVQEQGRGSNRGYVVAYILKVSVPIQPVLNFSQTVDAAITRSLQDNFSKAFEYAKATAK